METTLHQNAPVETKNSTKVGDFGNGRYSAVMGELYTDSQRLLGLSDKQAHATAARLGIDLGRLNAGKAGSVTVGKSVSKDGYRTVREVCSVKMPNSWALSVAVICNGLDNLRKQGLETIENSIAKQLLEFINDATTKLFKAE